MCRGFALQCFHYKYVNATARHEVRLAVPYRVSDTLRSARVVARSSGVGRGCMEVSMEVLPFGTIDATDARVQCLEEQCNEKRQPNCSAACHSALQTAQIPPPTSKASFLKICKPTLGLNLRYCSNFYGKAAADTIFQQLEKQLRDYLPTTQQTVTLAGRALPISRRRTAFGDRGLSYSYSGITVQANPWIPLVSALKSHVEEAIGEHFNFVLVNRYKDGRDHIGEHRDDEHELEQSAPIASLSFGQARDFILRHKDARGWKNGIGQGRGGKRGRLSGGTTPLIEPVKIELSHGSLLVMCHPTNSTWYHSLPVRRRALHPRINLTFRRLIVHHEKK